MQNRDLADDVLQEAFIRIWHNAGEYTTNKGQVLTWMISIVRYREFDALRFNKVRTGQGRDDETVLISEDSVSLSEQEKKQLDFCLEELDSIQKQAIHLAFFNGLTHQEVAKHISRPLGSSKSLIRRGMQSLKRCLGI
ncbi:MAG: RNA polymerase sigma factor (sigma-70 family) [Paraglaciecola sp.]|jgi:RNA polymerase sigma factor (sigma-70 family)